MKLLSLQGLRGISIILVLIFHLFPKEFVNGFVGVDMLIMSLAAAVLCFLCGRLEQTFLTSQPLVFIGDISYVTYLVHWPVINFVRYIQQKDYASLSVSEALISIVIIYGVSLLVHYGLEKRLLQLDFYVNFVTSALLVGLCVSMIPWIKGQECLAIKTLPNTVQEQLIFNGNMSNILKEVSDLPCDYNETTADLAISIEGVEYCSHTSNGTGKILIIGNSLSVRAFAPIFKLFDGNYEELRLFAKHGGAPLLNIFPYYNQAVIAMAEEMKPDLLWIIQGINEIAIPGPDAKHDLRPVSLDHIVAETMNKFKVLAKKVYIDLPYYVTKLIPLNLVSRSLIYRKNLDDNLSVSLLDVERQLGAQTERLLDLNCSNCYFNDVQTALTNESDKFYLYEKDTNRALIYDGSHLSFAGYERLEPMYRQRIEQFYEILN
ncbi:hypothetical protein CAEBREN_10023 [Caenorhabditis brenneri]|uniref:SGNH domain-containing protein n=1 Tax=Caenorhabditis brenneri TaxID=135651 RepID=G0MAA5_CAEBE|nr:hypothetical protein CAEBREN_10023 [Caenorhabditis brenneri]